MLLKHMGLPLYGLMAQAAKMDDPSPGNVADARQHLAQRATMPKVLNDAAIVAFFEGDQAQRDAQKIAGAEKSRLNWLVHLMFKTERDGDVTRYEPIADLTTVKEAVKGYVKRKADDAGWKGGKGAGKPPAPVKSARNRAGEIKALYAAIRFAGFDVTGKGYHDAVNGAKEALLANGINADGKKIPDEEMRKRQRLAAQEGNKVGAAVKAAQEKAAELGRPLTDEERAEIFKDAEGVYLKGAAMDICNDILKRGGVKMAEEVAAFMPQAIEQFLATKEGEKQ